LQISQLEARIEWLSRYIKENVPVRQTEIEDVESGSLVASSQGASMLAAPTLRSGVQQSGGPNALNTSNPNEGPGFSTLDGPGVNSIRSRGTATSAWAYYRDGGREPPLTPAYTMPVHVSESAGSPLVGRGPLSDNNPSMCDSRTLRLFVDAYFQNVHRAYPFIDRSRILRDLADARHDMVNLSQWRRSTDTTTLLYLVMAIGCTTLQRAGRYVGASFDVPYSGIIHECLSRADTESVRVLVLLALRSLFDPGALSTWVIVGLAARQGVLLGLTRRAPQDGGLSPTEIELQHRLFWGIYVLDRMVSVSLGLPMALTDENMDVPLPSLTPEEFNTAVAERPSPSHMLQTSRHVIQLREIEDRILSRVLLRKNVDVAQLPLADRVTLAHEIRGDIENWYSNGCLVTPQETDNIPIHSSMTWLNARYYQLLVLLYYPSRFTSFGLLVPCTKLIEFAQKHIRATYTLFQHRQLPLNRVTLYRIFPVALVLLYGFMACAEEGLRFPARDEIATLVGILQAFPNGDWLPARRAAQHLAHFLNLVSNFPVTVSTGMNPAVSTHFASSMSPGPQAPALSAPSSSECMKETMRGSVRPTVSSFISLMEEVLGKSSCYCVRDILEQRETGIGGSARASIPAVQDHMQVELDDNGNASLGYIHDPASLSGSNIPFTYTWDSLELSFL